MFYENLKEICGEKGIKITPLILECGGTKGMLSGWKNGASPSIEIISKLAIYLNVSTDLLIFGKTSNDNELEQARINNSVHTGNVTNSRIVTEYKSKYIKDDDILIHGLYSGIVKRLDNLLESQRYRAIADIIELIDTKYNGIKK